MNSPATLTIPEALVQAQAARDQAQWERAVEIYGRIEQVAPESAEVKHNLGLCYFGWGKPQEALHRCSHAFSLKPDLWQSQIIVAKSHQALGEMLAAQRAFSQLIEHPEASAQARIGLADLAMNQFGNPLGAITLVEPLLLDPAFGMDAQLTTLMASLYERADWDRRGNALALSQKVKNFSAEHLRLPTLTLEPFSDRTRAYKTKSYRPRVGLISPLFCVSPVYFLTIAGFRHIAQQCDLVFFNRGHAKDWATQAFLELSSEWLDVQHLSAYLLAQRIHSADLDVLYDLGGWMDAVALQALSSKPARKLFKWVGGQSITTGLDSFDGWIGDYAHSPVRYQPLYSEPLINVAGGYASYTPPDYLPRVAKTKSKTPCVFANPAKISQAFLQAIKKIRGPIVFIHHLYRFSQVQEKISAVLGARAQFVIPNSHLEALEALNEFAVMLDTFPYSSGLTAREAIALGTKVKVLQVGELFCERHTANLVK